MELNWPGFCAFFFFRVHLEFLFLVEQFFSTLITNGEGEETKVEPYGGPNTSLARGRKLLICISSCDQLLGSIVGKCAVRGNSKRGCNSRCCFFLTQLHLTCRFLDTGWELCDLGQVASPRPFGRGTVTESVCRAVEDSRRRCRQSLQSSQRPAGPASCRRFLPPPLNSSH